MTTPALLTPPWTPDGLAALPARPVANIGARTLTRADNDLDAVSGWLLRHQDSPHTFDSYKREAERLLAWCASRSQSLATLMAEDLVAYQRFLQDLQPRKQWCLQSEPRYLAPRVLIRITRSIHALPASVELSEDRLNFAKLHKGNSA